MEVAQNLLNLNMDVLLRTSKKTFFRVGLLFNRLNSSSVSVIYKNYNAGYYSFGSSEIEKEYSPTYFQTGFTLGLSIPFKLFNRKHMFNVKFVEIVSPLVKQDYYLAKSLIGEDLKVLSVKARPEMLMLGLDFSFKKIRKKKTENE